MYWQNILADFSWPSVLFSQDFKSQTVIDFIADVCLELRQVEWKKESTLLSLPHIQMKYSMGKLVLLSHPPVFFGSHSLPLFITKILCKNFCAQRKHFLKYNVFIVFMMHFHQCFYFLKKCQYLFNLYLTFLYTFYSELFSFLSFKLHNLHFAAFAVKV